MRELPSQRRLRVISDAEYPPLTRIKMDLVKCDIHGQVDEYLTLRPRCHLSAGTTPIFIKRLGVLQIRCAECDRLVANIAIAHN